MRSWLRFDPLAILAMCFLPSSASAAAVPSAPALPDTGLFAPVAAQFRARSEQLLRTEREPVTPERLRLLLATGRPEEAAKLMEQATGDPRELAVARARVMLARQDFAALRTAMAAIPAGPTAHERERSLGFAWRVARDDAAGVDSLTRAAVASNADAIHVPELLAAGV